MRHESERRSAFAWDEMASGDVIADGSDGDDRRRSCRARAAVPPHRRRLGRALDCQRGARRRAGSDGVRACGSGRDAQSGAARRADRGGHRGSAPFLRAADHDGDQRRHAERPRLTPAFPAAVTDRYMRCASVRARRLRRGARRRGSQRAQRPSARGLDGRRDQRRRHREGRAAQAQGHRDLRRAEPEPAVLVGWRPRLLRLRAHREPCSGGRLVRHFD